jgi:(2Fe-2S) ferredoxin
MSFYNRHIFFCTNVREDGICCSDYGAQEIREYAKNRAKELGITGQGKLRVNSSGCLDRCSEGPVAVVYPEGVWYTYDSKEDVDEIIEEHLINGRIVEHLII